MPPSPRLAAAALAVLAVSACSGGSDGDGSATGGEPSDAASVQAETTNRSGEEDPAPVPAAEVFEGSTADFYEPMTPVPDGPPGTLLRHQDLGERDGVRTWRVMYLSDDGDGEAVPTTGLVSAPTGTAPDGGWPVVSYGHGTAGIAPQCAPSRLGLPAPQWGIDGVAAATDYVGLGPTGQVHRYLSPTSEGNAMVDIVEAASRLPGVETSELWAAVGHSQGGHAAMAARELAAERAPERTLAAAVAIAPGVVTDRSWNPTDRMLMDLLTLLQIHSAERSGADVALEELVTADVLAARGVFETGCVDEVVNAMAPVLESDPWVTDPWATDPARSLLESNRVGLDAVPSVPLMVVSGSADPTVLPQRVEALVELLCADPGFVRNEVIEGADHGSVVVESTDVVGEFLADAIEAARPGSGVGPDGNGMAPATTRPEVDAGSPVADCGA